MEVDDDDDDDGQRTEAGGDTDAEMSVDEDGNATSKARARPLGPRKSHLNMQALTEEQAVLAQYPPEQLALMDLQRKYYREALKFIHHIETAMETVEKLLGSKSKPEVAEVIDFFRVAHEYEFSGAKVSVFCCICCG